MDKTSTLVGVGSNHAGDPLWSILDIRGTLMDKISTLGGGEQSRWGSPMDHFGPKGDPYGQNFYPRFVGRDHAGDSLGANLDLRGSLISGQNCDPGSPLRTKMAPRGSPASLLPTP